MKRGGLPLRAAQAPHSPVRRFVWGVLGATLVGCTQPPPPPVPVPIALLPPRIQPPRPPEPVNASWSFSVTQTACVARAVSREVSLTLSFGSNSKLEFTLSAQVLRSGGRAGARGRLQFHGGTGSWVWPARVDPHSTLTVLPPPSKTAAKDVLIALDGGTLRTEFIHVMVPPLRVPAANVAGREWFDCVRAKIDQANTPMAQR